MDTDAPAASTPATKATARDWLILVKPGIMVALLISALTAMVVAAGGFPRIELVIAVAVGGALASGSAATLNNLLERDRDQKMRRTRKRALPSHRIEVSHAAILATTFAGASVLTLSTLANALSAALAFAGILFYAFVYTHWLKPLTPQNIVIGGAAGCFPALVGWSAVTGDLSLGALLLALIVFLWTPPHFWSLALLYRDDYAEAGIPMLPVTHGDEVTRRQIFAYSVVLVAATAALYPLGVLGWVYLAIAAALGGLFVAYAAILLMRREKGPARALFRYSNMYLALLGVAMVADVAFRLTA